MARYRIVGWRGIPSLVEITGEGRSFQRPLSQRFQDLIDAVAVKDGASDSETYLAGWEQGPESERPGDAEAVADAVVAELEAGFHDLLAHRLPRR